jgi:hypothetical protein
LKSINHHSLDILFSFDVSLFTDVPADEALLVIRNKLRNDYTLVERSALQPEAIIKLLEVCLRTTYQVDDSSSILSTERWQGYGELSVTYQ